MARRWVVSDGTNAQEVQADAAKVAVGGVVKPIKIACVAEGGVVRQFYPPAPSFSNADPRIVWNTTALTVSNSAIDPLDATASITFNRATGQYSYTTYPTGNAFATFLNPALDGTAGDDTKYLIKVDQVSGTTIVGTLATWIDLNAAASLSWTLPLTVVGTGTALANISISQDDGAGSPVAATTVVKAVTFNAEVTTISKIAWTTTQNDLVEITEGADADCILTFNPDGTAVGDAATSGSFNEDWHIDTPAVASPALFSVKATLISGTAPTGSALGTALTLDAVREWTLLATIGENLSCALDIEVDNVPTAAPIVKRVTMNSQRVESISYNNWSTSSWVQIDDNPLGGQVTLTLANDGTATYTNGTVLDDLTENWHSQAPTPTEPENYEVKLVLISGDSSLMTGSAINTWLPLSVNQAWNAAGIAGLLRLFTWDVYVRKIGDASVIKRVTAQVGTEGLL